MKCSHAKYIGLISLLFLMFSTAFAQQKSRIAFKISEPDLITRGHRLRRANENDLLLTQLSSRSQFIVTYINSSF